VDSAYLHREVNFKDLNCDDKKDLCITIAPYDDPTFTTQMAEVEIAIQVTII
jgi:hypothetical protein